MRIRLFCIALLVLVVNCARDEFNSENERSKDNDRELNASEPSCVRNEVYGCIEGQLSVAPDVIIDGLEYADINAYVAEFKEHIVVNNKDGDRIKPEEFEVVWIDLINNQSFANDFAIFLKGPEASQSQVRRNGQFVLNKLRGGTYDLRAQKVFRLAMANKYMDHSESDEPGAVSEPLKTFENLRSDVPNQFCLNVIADDTIEVQRDFRTTGVVLDHFYTELRPCNPESNDQPITI